MREWLLRMADKAVTLLFGPNVPYTWEPTCEYCGEPLPCEGAAHIIEVTYQGHGGSRIDPPEPAEMIIECHQCQKETDAQIDFAPEGYCMTGDHDVLIDVPDDVDPDLAYEQMRDRKMGL